jgi:hypothetical protein
VPQWRLAELADARRARSVEEIFKMSDHLRRLLLSIQDAESLTFLFSYLAVFLVFSWKCLPRACCNDSFVSLRLLLAFVLLALFALRALISLNSMPDTVLPYVYFEHHELVRGAQEQLLYGFGLFFVMSAAHLALWISRRSKGHSTSRLKQIP